MAEQTCWDTCPHVCHATMLARSGLLTCIRYVYDILQQALSVTKACKLIDHESVTCRSLNSSLHIGHLQACLQSNSIAIGHHGAAHMSKDNQPVLPSLNSMLQVQGSPKCPQGGPKAAPRLYHY